MFVILCKSDHICHITFARSNFFISFVITYLLKQDCQIIFVVQTSSDYFHQITVVRIHLSDYVGKINFVKLCLYDDFKITYKNHTLGLLRLRDQICQIRLLSFYASKNKFVSLCLSNDIMLSNDISQIRFVDYFCLIKFMIFMITFVINLTWP